MHSPAMRAAGAARVAPSAAAARPRTSAGKGRGVAPPCAATKRTSPEAAQNELAALKRQVQQAEQLISAGKLAEAEQILGFIVPTMSIDNSRAGRNPVKSAGVIWGVLATESSEAQSPPQGGAAAPAVAPAAAPPAAQDEPAVSDEELLSSALIVPAVAMDISRPPPSESFTAWLLQSDEAIAAVKAKALKARRDGTDPADAFSDANGLVTYIASLTRDEQLEMEPDLRAAMEARRRVADAAPEGTAADPELAALLCGCASLCAARGEYAEADMLYRDALALLRRRAEAAAAAASAAASAKSGGGLFGAFAKKDAARGAALPAGPAAELQLCLASLAKLAQARGALNEAEALWRDALAAADALFGPGLENPNAAARDATRALALLAAARGQDTQAAKLFREAAAIELAMQDAAAKPLPQRVA